MKFAALSLILFIFGIRLSAQSEHFASVRLLAHFNFKMKVPSMDDAGVGLHGTTSLFAQKPLHAVITVHTDRLMGDKSFYVPGTGRLNKAGVIHGIQAGSEYFFVPKVGVSFEYGLFYHSVNAVDFSTDDGYRFALTTLLGKQKKFVLQLSRTVIPTDRIGIRHWQFGTGYRFF